MAPGELKRMCLFGREDGLFQYRIDDFILDDEEYVSYWREGYPLSGLFLSVAEAEHAGENELRSFSLPREA